MAKQAPKEGVFIGKNSRGFYYRIKENQHILAFAGGYNTKQNAIKGLNALRKMLNNNTGEADGTIMFDADMVIDLAKKAPLKKK